MDKVICKNCEAGNVIIGYNTYFVTRDMARDVGELQFEGMIYSEEPLWAMCNCCEGEFENCRRCRRDKIIKELYV